MIKKDKVYELKIEEDDEVSGIDSISLVDEPAIEINWMYFSKEKPHEFHIPDNEDSKYIDKLKSVAQNEQDLLDEGWVVSKVIPLGKQGFITAPDPNGPSVENETEYRVRYKYVLNPQAQSPSIIPTTRDFCRELVQKNYVWRLEDLDTLTNDEGDSALVWRGGYNCRHLWARIEYTLDSTIRNKASVNTGKIDPQAPLDTRVLGMEQPDTRVPEWPSFSKQGFERVSIDYDDTLSTQRGKDLARRLLLEGKELVIVTRRRNSELNDVRRVAKEVGIDKIYNTNGLPKWNKLKELGIQRHIDNSQDELDSIKKNAPLIRTQKFEYENMVSVSDYPDSVKNNAKAVLKWVDENGWGSCGTEVGKIRANQLANGEPISEDTVRRMYSYLSRHKVDLESSKSYDDGCGKLMYDSWGGLSALSWAEGKVNTFNKQKFVESCPTATQDVATNLKNRQECIDVANYGPLNPNEPNEEYWKKKADMFGGDLPSAKKALCGNCSFFVQTKSMLDCIANGINDTNEWDTIDAGDLGYCEAFDFKCAASRTCDAWVVGGPITEEDMGYDVGTIGGFEDPNIKKKKKKKDQKFAIDNEEKRTIVGPAMVPDLRIPRKDNQGNMYEVYFSSETIKMIADKYMKNQYTRNNDLMHDGTAVKDVYVVESWIKEDDNDKSNKYGYGDLPIGTWFVAMKCAKTPQGDKVWEMVKSGELAGYSVSGWFEEVAAFCREEMFLQKVVEILKKY